MPEPDDDGGSGTEEEGGLKTEDVFAVIQSSDGFDKIAFKYSDNSDPNLEFYYIITLGDQVMNSVDDKRAFEAYVHGVLEEWQNNQTLIDFMTGAIPVLGQAISQIGGEFNRAFDAIDFEYYDTLGGNYMKIYFEMTIFQGNEMLDKVFDERYTGEVLIGLDSNNSCDFDNPLNTTTFTLR